jgi:hypothetical protein
LRRQEVNRRHRAIREFSNKLPNLWSNYLNENMKRIFAVFIVLSALVACQKQQTEAERQSEIDREVQQRLDAEHQAQEKQQIDQRAADLDAREKALAEKENTTSQPNENTPTTERDRPQEERPVSDEVPSRRGGPAQSYDMFYTRLDRYGDWMETSDYGYVFRPREAQSGGWRPYTDGRWVYTDCGWTWISEEPFGWATYHYGRWTRLRGIGWIWIPGDEWAPAWVSWRTSDNYVGWAPLPPEARFDRRTGIHNWADSYYDIGPENYCFVEAREIGSQRLERAVVPTERNVTIISQTINVTNISYNNTTVVNQGPNYDELRSRSAQPIERLKVERDVNININVGDTRPVVRGGVVVIQAPVIGGAEPARRPQTVKQTVTNAVVEHGWAGIQDKQAAEQARAKIRAEATAPPNAPSKTFVKPVTQTGAPTGTTATVAPAVTSAPRETRPPSVAPTATPAPTRPVFPRAVATPRPTAAPTAATESTQTPMPTPKRGRFPLESPAPSVGRSATGIPVPPRPRGASSVPATGAVGSGEQDRQNPMPFTRPRVLPTPTASPVQTALPSLPPSLHNQIQSSNPAESATESSPQSKGGWTGKGLKVPNESASAPPMPTRPPLPPDKRELQREMQDERQQLKQERDQIRKGLTSPTPSPSASKPLPPAP